MTKVIEYGIVLGLCMGALASMGCEEVPERRVSHFDLAEDAYRSGQYELAHQHYGVFLRQNPDPQLARLAERRILSIEREIECVLGKKNGPRPAYVQRKRADAISAGSQSGWAGTNARVMMEPGACDLA